MIDKIYLETLQINGHRTYIKPMRCYRDISTYQYLYCSDACVAFSCQLLEGYRNPSWKCTACNSEFRGVYEEKEEDK